MRVQLRFVRALSRLKVTLPIQLRCLAVIAAIFPVAASAQDWYLAAGSTCSGPTPLSAALATYFPKNLSLKPIPPAGNASVQVTATELAAYLATNPYSYSEANLDASKSDSLRTVFKNATEKVPLLAKVTNAFLLNYGVTNVPLNVAAGVLFDYFYQNVEAQPIAIENISGYVAVGGKLERTFSVRKSPNGGRFLLSQVTYSVAVGQEIRSFVLEACQFPVALLVSEFQTTGQYNNKIIKPRNGNAWGVFDLTDNKWDDLQLNYVRQEIDYFVFESDEVENNVLVGKTTHRLSVVGGPWSRKRSNSTTYSNLYLNVNAK